MADKTHWDCDKPAFSESFALAEGGVNATGAAWLAILVDSDSSLFTLDSSECIEA